MAHRSAVLSQIVRFFPRHEFQTLADKHYVGQKFRTFSRWTQFVSMLTAQLSNRSSLRDVVDNFGVQSSKFYHLGIKVFSRRLGVRTDPVARCL
jgi:putative transposase